MENTSNSYTPFDISSLKKAKIANEKDLENEIAKITEVLKDTRIQSLFYTCRFS